jgi:hypothetical protein
MYLLLNTCCGWGNQIEKWRATDRINKITSIFVPKTKDVWRRLN